MFGSSGPRGPVERVAHVPPERRFGVRVLKLFGTAVRHQLVPSGVSTEVPRRISLGFAHSVAAVGNLRRGGRTQHAPIGNAWISCELQLMHAGPVELRNIVGICNEIRVRQRDADTQDASIP